MKELMIRENTSQSFFSIFNAILLSIATIAIFISGSIKAESMELGFAFPSTVDIDDVALLLAFEAMESDDIKVKPTFFAQGELATLSLAQGQMNMGASPASNALTAIQKGAPIVGVSLQIANGWSLMANTSVESCGDMEGKATAIHSEGSVSTAMLNTYLDSECPTIKPNYLIIPGSENRTAALMAGKIEITPVELVDSMRIMALRPGQFHRIADFAGSLPALKTSGVWANKSFATEQPHVVRSLLTHLLKVHRRIKDNPEWFMDQVPRFLEMDDSELALLPLITDALLAIDNYPVNGGLTLQDGEYTIDFFTAAGRLESGLKASDAYDLSFLNDTLEELGRHKQP